MKVGYNLAGPSVAVLHSWTNKFWLIVNDSVLPELFRAEYLKMGTSSKNTAFRISITKATSY